jgi:hypothetical protein
MQDIVVEQTADGDNIIFGRRFTNSGSSGNFMRFNNATDSASLFQIDTTGTMITGTVPEARISWTNPGANTIRMWDNTDGAMTNATIGSNLTYTHSTHTLAATVPTVASTSLALAGDGAGNVVAATTSTSAVFNNIDLGNSDTTLARQSSGVLSVEGVAVPTVTSTSTLTNKRITKRVLDSNAPSSPVTPDSDSYDQIVYRGISAALTINAPSGTPTAGQLLVIRFKDDGTARALTWTEGSSGAMRFSSDLAKPTTTTLSKTLYTLFIWNATDSRWDMLSKLDNF